VDCRCLIAPLSIPLRACGRVHWGSGEIHSQEYGALLPHYDLIATFDTPPIPPESFFDVYFEIPMSELPVGWSGYILVTAANTVPVGTVCCFAVNFTCLNQTVTVNLCATACDCSGVETESRSWGNIKVQYK
jgi:hypothetical protein